MEEHYTKKLKFSFQPPPEAYTYCPTEEEFRDPLEFVRAIKSSESFGICKIIPPSSWKPHFALDSNSFKFDTRIQALGELGVDARLELQFLENLEKYNSLRGVPFTRSCNVSKKPLNFFQLYREVNNNGGFSSVVKKKLWMRIGKKLGLNKTTCTSMSNQLRTAYERYILPFEKYKNAICELKEEHEHCLSLNKKNFSVYKRNKPEIPDDCLRDCSLKRSSETSPVTVCKDDIEKEKVDSYGFPPGSHYTLTTFKIKADNFKKNYFGTLAVPSSQVELEFWDIIKRRRAVSVEYGADLQTSKLGSGFPSARHMTDHLSHYDASHGWNLNNLPLHKNCVLSGFGSNISGMTVPWLYVGMCFATFCWHVEDHYTYSVNYLHKGDKKIWYGVPGHEGGNFETVARKLMPALFEEQPDLLCHLTTMIHPNVLMQQGIPVYRIEQNPGEFVITFPRAYHAGFNQGFNFAEAVNFTPADWIPWGRQCVSDYTAIGRHHVFSHDEMLCFIASKAVGLTPELAAYVAADLYTSIQLEKEARKKFLAYTNFPRDAKILQTASIEFEKIPDEKRTCKYCRCTCFLSAVVCISCDIYADCHVETISLWHAQSFARDRLVGGDSQGGCLSPSWKHVSCLTHLTDLCSCPLSMKFLLYRYTMEELNVLLINICGRNKASV